MRSSTMLGHIRLLVGDTVRFLPSMYNLVTSTWTINVTVILTNQVLGPNRLAGGRDPIKAASRPQRRGLGAGEQILAATPSQPGTGLSYLNPLLLSFPLACYTLPLARSGMVGTSWSSSSSCTSSLGSLDDDVVCVLKPAAATEGSVKFLCSYGGRILPRHTDGALRYVGGDNRVLSVDRPLHFYELQRKLRELCGSDVFLRCQLPTEDLDALVSVTGDDDLANLLEEYDAAGKDRLQPLKIRAFLFPRTTAPSLQAPPRGSPPPTPASASSRPSASNARNLHRQNTSPAAATAARAPSSTTTCAPRWWAAPLQASRPARAHHQQTQRYDRHGLGGVRPHGYLVHNGSHWQ